MSGKIALHARHYGLAYRYLVRKSKRLANGCWESHSACRQGAYPNFYFRGKRIQVNRFMLSLRLGARG
jgi:hypothetical protein